VPSGAVVRGARGLWFMPYLVCFGLLVDDLSLDSLPSRKESIPWTLSTRVQVSSKQLRS
jgi:hypothetical protein